MPGLLFGFGLSLLYIVVDMCLFLCRLWSSAFIFVVVSWSCDVASGL